MDRRRFLLSSLAGVLGARPAAGAQQTRRVARIGYLLLPPLAEKPSAERQAFLQGLRELGYEEGHNVVVEYRSAVWNLELLSELAAELVELKVDVILAAGPQPSMAAREATGTIPIVMIAGIDPVAGGLVDSLARPGANLTGFTLKPPGLIAKGLELFREVLPRGLRILVIWNPGNPAAATDWKETQSAARTLGVKLGSLEVRGAETFLAALQRLQQHLPAAVMMIDDTVTVAYRQILAEFALKHHVPAVMARRDFVEAGGLMSYAPKASDLFRRAAGHVDKILKGATPASLPIEQPTTFELVINLKTAKALGLTIPPTLLARADQLIE
jgi:putative tryptophan/tyrosine transport system substrate-binding protein